MFVNVPCKIRNLIKKTSVNANHLPFVSDKWDSSVLICPCGKSYYAHFASKVQSLVYCSILLLTVPGPIPFWGIFTTRAQSVRERIRLPLSLSPLNSPSQSPYPKPTPRGGIVSPRVLLKGVEWRDLESLLV